MPRKSVPRKITAGKKEEEKKWELFPVPFFLSSLSLFLQKNQLCAFSSFWAESVWRGGPFSHLLHLPSPLGLMGPTLPPRGLKVKYEEEG